MPKIKTYIPKWLLWEYIEHFNIKQSFNQLSFNQLWKQYLEDEKWKQYLEDEKKPPKDWMPLSEALKEKE